MGRVGDSNRTQSIGIRGKDMTSMGLYKRGSRHRGFVKRKIFITVIYLRKGLRVRQSVTD